ncbi:mandelate racemase/muconate lactonizing enzyme family protein [Demequina muriae]|uniref:mandelate racemase/muconate lactonizing enzyme family protein n=1 Tax=Demequina muriae TaxID=3051664 RepID=UPI00345E890F
MPLSRPWGPDVSEVSVIVVDVQDSDGASGQGFAWTPSIGARAVLAMIEDHVLPHAVGRPASPDAWTDGWEHVHEAGGGGVTTIALAGLDLALWDLRCRRESMPLADALGRRHDTQPAYGSGVNLHYSLHELVSQAKRWVEAGFGAVKVKVGRPTLAEDLERLRAVRDVIGPERSLMVDANQRWDVDTAAVAANAMAEVGIAWLEEPLRADDLAGHVALKARTSVPIALGENLHTLHRFRDFIAAGAVDVVQPNVIRVGGITPFLDVAALARDAGVALAPHLLPEISAQLAFALPERTWVEDVEGAGFWQSGALKAPTGVTIADGRVSGGRRAGLGFEFKEEIS